MLSIQDQEFVLDDYEEIVFVSSETIKIRCKQMMLEVTGRHLYIVYLYHEEVMIHGTIDLLRFIDA